MLAQNLIYVCFKTRVKLLSTYKVSQITLYLNFQPFAIFYTNNFLRFSNAIFSLLFLQKETVYGQYFYEPVNIQTHSLCFCMLNWSRLKVFRIWHHFHVIIAGLIFINENSSFHLKQICNSLHVFSHHTV